MTSVACVVIASENRKYMVETRVVPSVMAQGFDEVVVVGDWDSQDALAEPRYISIGPIHCNTLDALLKRDAGTLATSSPTILYLCDDHALAPNFLAELRGVLDEPWDVLVPNRHTRLPGTDEYVPLNMGEAEHYCAGHAGVFRRELVEWIPWMTFARGPFAHTRLWDVNSSHELQSLGARFIYHPRAGIAVEDLEPERKPWT